METKIVYLKITFWLKIGVLFITLKSLGEKICERAPRALCLNRAGDLLRPLRVVKGDITLGENHGPHE